VAGVILARIKKEPVEGTPQVKLPTRDQCGENERKKLESLKKARTKKWKYGQTLPEGAFNP